MEMEMARATEPAIGEPAALCNKQRSSGLACRIGRGFYAAYAVYTVRGAAVEACPPEKDKAVL